MSKILVQNRSLLTVARTVDILVYAIRAISVFSTSTKVLIIDISTAAAATGLASTHELAVDWWFWHFHLVAFWDEVRVLWPFAWRVWVCSLRKLSWKVNFLPGQNRFRIFRACWLRFRIPFIAIYAREVLGAKMLRNNSGFYTDKTTERLWKIYSIKQ